MASCDRVKPTVLHIITGLPIGGAQTALRQLVERSAEDGYRMPVISLSELGTVGANLQSQGFKVQSMNISRSRPTPLDLFRLMSMINSHKPDVIQTWMYHADLLGGIAARLCTRVPVIWNIRHSDLQLSGIKNKTIFIAKACAKISSFVPNKIICNSHYAARLHIEMGYAKDRLIVLPNGIDTTLFHPTAEDRAGLCKEIQAAQDEFLIGHIARYHPQKDHRSFIEAAGMLCKRFPNVRFVLCGEDVDSKNQDLASAIDQTGHSDRFHLLGLRSDIPKLMASMNITVSSSAFGEGFSNVLGESMASGTPCVSTDSGDAKYIIKNTGWVVGKQQPQALAEAIGSAIRETPDAMHNRAIAARERIHDNFSLPKITAKYLSLYESVSS